MGPVEITILVVSIVLGLYLLLFIVDSIFVFAFRKIFNKHNMALGVILHTKYENIKKMVDILNKFSVNVPYKYIETLNSIDATCFRDQELPECIKARNDLAFLRNELVYMVTTIETLNKNNELIRAKESITELDSNYRSLVAMYNADVLGYNYWINFWPTRYVKFICKFKEKQIIS